MKFGVRKPSLKKSVKARTTGRVKRKIKSSVNPLYGKKGMGYARDPKRAVYNKVYRKTTAGVNPLSGVDIRSRENLSKTFSRNRHAIGFTKREIVEKELLVKSAFEQWFRRLLRKSTIETKTVQKNVIIEQYTYEEIYSIQEDAREVLDTFKQSMRYLSDTSNPDVFFPRLKEAEKAISELAGYTRRYSFLVNDGEDVVETYHRFIQEKDNLIKQFVHTHFSESLKGAETLKTDRGKQNRLKSDYSDLSAYLDDLSSSSVTMINSVWRNVVSDKELTDNKGAE